MIKGRKTILIFNIDIKTRSQNNGRSSYGSIIRVSSVPEDISNTIGVF